MNPTEIINEIAKRIGRACGYVTEMTDFLNSDHPRAKHFINLAEIAYETIYEDSPDYGDLDEEEDTDPRAFRETEPPIGELVEVKGREGQIIQVSATKNPIGGFVWKTESGFVCWPSSYFLSWRPIK